jgi:hypothetical protein
MKLRIHFFDKPSGPNAPPTILAHPSGDFGSLDEARKIALADGARLTKDEGRVLSWSKDDTLRLWDAGWPKGNLLEVACVLLPIEDRNASDASKHFGVTIKDPICSPESATIVPEWSLIERAPVD